MTMVMAVVVVLMLIVIVMIMMKTRTMMTFLWLFIVCSPVCHIHMSVHLSPSHNLCACEYGSKFYFVYPPSPAFLMIVFLAHFKLPLNCTSFDFKV